MRILVTIKDPNAFIRQQTAKCQKRRKEIEAMNKKAKEKQVSEMIYKIKKITKRIDNLSQAMYENRMNKSIFFVKENLWLERYILYYSIPGNAYRAKKITRAGIHPPSYPEENKRMKLLAKRLTMDYRYRYRNVASTYGNNEKIYNWRFIGDETDRKARKEDRTI